IEVINLNKSYQIYSQPRERLKQLLFPKIQKILGRPQKVYYKDFAALKNINFKVKKGQTIGIIGRNGSGKSTLLQLICGTLHPSAGEVCTQGRVAALLELGSGFNPEFTGRENIYLNGSVLGLSNEQIDARFDQIESFADIGEFIDQAVKTYSSGMMLRLAFAVIAHVDADILIIDEALSVGDAAFTQKCMRFLRQFMENGTVFFVSHDTGAILNLCDSAIWLHRGEIQSLGDAKTVVEKYLESLHLETVGHSAPEVLHKKEFLDSALSTVVDDYRDLRTSLINRSTLRNDIEVFQFDPNKHCFGLGGATIISVKILNDEKQPLSWFVGGEKVTLEIRTKTHRNLDNPIVGFHFKDRLGQIIFADNTYLTHQHDITVKTNQTIITRFEFYLPMLPTGDYSIDAAIANGTAQEHTQQHWVHDGLTIKVHASAVRYGLVGLPIKNISMEILNE
ncbi:MAG: ABC transporter ATP-binding protein, partial [Pusillimonas sp.]|nr:ABC transporter ATP-binding protein [Pusillimonas sp.]